MLPAADTPFFGRGAPVLDHAAGTKAGAIGTLHLVVQLAGVAISQMFASGTDINILVCIISEVRPVEPSPCRCASGQRLGNCSGDTGGFAG